MTEYRLWIAIILAAALVFVLVYRLSARPVRPPSKRTKRVAAKRAPATQVAQPVPSDELPKVVFDEDIDVDPTLVGTRSKSLSPPTNTIIYDEDAVTDEPTQSRPLVLVTATGQTDKGIRRKRNEDSLLVLEDESLFVVADGMGGYRGGEIASDLAVSTIERAFTTQTFEGIPHESMPRRASELARAIQMANEAILLRANTDRLLEGMGTTLSAIRFSRNKQRLYVAHVGDSRVYCYRGQKLRCMTSDHTMADFGVAGAGAAHLSRAVGIWPTVPIDIILGKPSPGDMYLICSDGLTKMVDDAEIEQLLHDTEPAGAVANLIRAANEHGGKDNVSVVVMRVDEPTAA